MTSLLLSLWIFGMFGGLFWLLQVKLRVLKRHGMKTGNARIRGLAKAGDADALELVRRQRIVVGYMVIVGVGLLFSRFLR